MTMHNSFQKSIYSSMRTVIAPFLKWDFQKGRYFHIPKKDAKVTEEGESLLCRGQTPVAAGGDSPPDQQAWRSKSAGTNEPIQSK